MKQLQVIFSGQVQGVGFRYTAKEIADDLSLSGFIKNLADGRVELLSQGEEKNLQKLLEKLNQNFQISDCQTTWSDMTQNTTQKFSSFEII